MSVLSVANRKGGVACVLFGLTAASGEFGCSSGPPPAAIVVPAQSVDASVDAGNGYAFQTLGCGSAGTQSAIAISGGKVGVASLAPTTSTQTCTISPLGPALTSEVPVWNVCYAESKGDGTFSSSVVTSQPYTSPTGVGLALDSTGNPGIAFTGVGATPATETCSSNDVFLVRATGGTFGAPVQVSNGSQSDGLVVSQAANCSQNVCNSGDVTGWWPALAFDPNDVPAIAYRDVHFGFSVDDLTAKSDLEVAEGSGSGYSVLTVDVSRGGGTYNRVAMTPAGLPVVLHYSTGGAPGVYIDREAIRGALAAQEADGGWSSDQLFSGQIGPQLGFGVNAEGHMAAAYYGLATSQLWYVESIDGVTWSSPVSVDANGLTGQYPSLAFDSNGDPAVAYYRCNADHSDTQCDATQDGLYLARRKSGTWSATVIHADPNVLDGLYPALGFAEGKAVIAFQMIANDAISQTQSTTWWIAEEQ